MPAGIAWGDRRRRNAEMSDAVAIGGSGAEGKDRLMTSPPTLDPIARHYVTLAFGIERQVPGYVDAYVGPAEVREEALTGPAPSPDALLDAARALAMKLAEADIAESRVGFLTTQVEAMIATCRRLAGEDFSYTDEVRACFDITPVRTPEATFADAIATLDQLLPGEGSVSERMVAWRQQFVLRPEWVQGVIDRVLPECRRRTAAIVDLPEGDEIEVRLVRDKPWRGYNWYLGDARSRVEFNTDLPIYAHSLPDLLCHEGYPGHHLEHALKDRRLYRKRGYGEHAIQLINTPECVISEGIATRAEEAIFPGEERFQFRRERVYPAAGVTGDPAREAAIETAEQALRGVAGNAALMLHVEGEGEAAVERYLQEYGLRSAEEARHQVRFIADPLWRGYIFTYHAGYDLLGAWLDGGPPGEREARFRTLLTEQVYPSLVTHWIAEDKAGRPSEPGPLDEDPFANGQ